MPKEVALQPISTVDTKPFGTGPWPCLNKASDHYKSLTISKPLRINQGKLGPIGIFMCPKCYFSYRVSSSTSPKISMVSPGKVWEQKLIDLVTQSNMSLNAIASTLGCKRATVLLHLDRLGITNHRWHWQKIRSKERKKEETRKRHRKIWQTILYQHPGAYLSEIKQLCPGTYEWLISNDKEWLQRHSPIKKKRKGSCMSRVDWGERDMIMYEEVKKAVESLLNAPGKPIRITKRAIAKKLNPEVVNKNWLLNKLNFLPKTKAYLDNAMESREAFLLRRVNWVAEEFIREGVIPTKKQFKLRGVLGGFSTPRLVTSINEALEYIRSTLENRQQKNEV